MMSELVIYVNRSYHDSSIAKVYRAKGEGKMTIVIPQFVILESQGFSQLDQRDITIALAREQASLLERAKTDDVRLELAI